MDHAVLTQASEFEFLSDFYFPLIMACQWQLPVHQLEVNKECILIRIYSPLCREHMCIVTEGGKVTYECYPYYLRLTLPHYYKYSKIERSYDELLEFHTLKFINQKSNDDKVDFKALHTDLVNSITANCKIGGRIGSVPDHPVQKPHYGFLNMYSDKFGLHYQEFSEVIDLTDPDNTKVHDRKILRMQDEQQKWNEDHYMADFMENDHMLCLYDYVPPWLSQKAQDFLTEYEQNFIQKIKIYDCFQKGLCNYQWSFGELQMIDVLLAYCYNKRITEGADTVMSAWTICKLSSTLSWFEIFESLQDVFLAFYRRTLTFPLYRNWDFTKRIQSDLTSLLRSGVNNVIRALIELQELFETTGNYYILNKLYINNMIHFCKHLPTTRLKELTGKIQMNLVNKKDVDFDDLSLVENVSLLVAREEEERVRASRRDVMSHISEETEEDSSSSEDESDDGSVN